MSGTPWADGRARRVRGSWQPRRSGSTLENAPGSTKASRSASSSTTGTPAGTADDARGVHEGHRHGGHRPRRLDGRGGSFTFTAPQSTTAPASRRGRRRDTRAVGRENGHSLSRFAGRAPPGRFATAAVARWVIEVPALRGGASAQVDQRGPARLRSAGHESPRFRQPVSRGRRQVWRRAVAAAPDGDQRPRRRARRLRPPPPSGRPVRRAVPSDQRALTAGRGSRRGVDRVTRRRAHHQHVVSHDVDEGGMGPPWNLAGAGRALESSGRIGILSTISSRSASSEPPADPESGLNAERPSIAWNWPVTAGLARSWRRFYLRPGGGSEQRAGAKP